MNLKRKERVPMSCQHRWVDNEFLEAMSRRAPRCPFFRSNPWVLEKFARFLLDSLPGPEPYLTREFIDVASRDLQTEFKAKLAITLDPEISSEMAVVIWTSKCWHIEPDASLEAITKSYLRTNPGVRC